METKGIISVFAWYIRRNAQSGCSADLKNLAKNHTT